MFSCVWRFAIPWTAARQASLSITNSKNLPKFMSIESVMPFNHFILSSPSPPTFNLSQHQGLFRRVRSSHQVAKVLELQLQHQSFNEYSGLIPLWLTGSNSLPSKGLSRVFSNTTVWKDSLVLSFLYGPNLTSIHDYWKNQSFSRQTFVGKVMSVLFHRPSRFVTAFLPRSKHLLISWLQSSLQWFWSSRK